MLLKREGRTVAICSPTRRAAVRRCSEVPPRTASVRREDFADTSPGDPLGPETCRTRPLGTFAPRGFPSGCRGPGSVAYLQIKCSNMRAMTKDRECTLHNACDLVVLVEVDELLLRRLRGRSVRWVTLAAECNVREIKPWMQQRQP